MTKEEERKIKIEIVRTMKLEKELWSFFVESTQIEVHNSLQTGTIPWSCGVGYAGAEGLWVLGDKVVVDAVLQRAQHNHRPGVLDLDLRHSIYVYVCTRLRKQYSDPYF